MELPSGFGREYVVYMEGTDANTNRPSAKVPVLPAFAEV
jgi:hypothetical protein